MTLIGILVAMALVVALFAILMTSMKGAMGGGGSTPVQQNQASTFVDRENLRQIYIGMATFAISNDSHLPSPTRIAHSDDKSIDTSANFWSAMIAQQIVVPGQLVSKNEQSDFVWQDEDYNVSYNPNAGLPWDTTFAADLASDSNVSFAHQPLYGERFRRGWMWGSSMYPVLANRGPKDGVLDPNSWTTHNTTGQWAGNIVYADGHVDFSYSMTPGILGGDNLFANETGQSGADAILSFTKEIWDGGFTLQWD